MRNIFYSKEITNFEKDIEKFIKKVRDCYYNKTRRLENSFSRKVLTNASKNMLSFFFFISIKR